MDIHRLAEAVLPGSVLAPLRRYRRARRRRAFQAIAPLSEKDFQGILTNDLGLGNADAVFVHSSLDYLSLSFSPFAILGILREIVGPDGVLLFPTYPRQRSYDFLKSGEVFDVRNTPSFTGILTEFARRQPDAKRSLHPTKSVCALGSDSEWFVSDHQRSVFPYDYCSPYYRTIVRKGKVVGLGASSAYLSLLHCVDDALGTRFPVTPYHEHVFSASCINARGEPVKVATRAHDSCKMSLDVPRFLKKFVPSSVAADIEVRGMAFFRAEAASLFTLACDLASEGRTIYSPRVYRKGERHG